MDNRVRPTHQAHDHKPLTTPTTEGATTWPTQTTLLTAKEVATRMNISEARAYELARLDIVPCVRLGRQVRFDPVKLEAWIESGGQALPGGWRITSN